MMLPGGERSASVEFTVDKDYQLPPHDYPRIVFLSRLNQTYTKNELPLTFTVDGQIVNAYCLLSNLNLSRYTKAVNVSISGNTTLTGLSNGTYHLYVIALTERGYAGQITYFKIDSQTTTQTLIPKTKMDNFSILKNPTIIIIAPAAIALVVVLTALVLAIQHIGENNLRQIVRER